MLGLLSGSNVYKKSGGKSRKIFCESPGNIARLKRLRGMPDDRPHENNSQH